MDIMQLNDYESDYSHSSEDEAINDNGNIMRQTSETAALSKGNSCTPSGTQVHMENCEHIIVGNITINVINQNNKTKSVVTSSQGLNKIKHIQKGILWKNEESVSSLESLKELSKSLPESSAFPMVTRKMWLAQSFVGVKQFFEEPPKYVVICHTITLEGFTRVENDRNMKKIQNYHIETRDFGDIGYNFCIGSDGNVYEGRGWNVVGCHSNTCNSKSIGISFVGNFTKHLPPASSLQKCKELIDYGVTNRFINKNYYLLAHRQCIKTESPGQRLFEEIATWEKWNNKICLWDP